MQQYIGHDGLALSNNKSFYFADNFDWIICKNKIIKKKDIPKSIYIKIDYINKWLKIILKIKHDFVLITGCSDFSPQIHFSRAFNKIVNLSNLLAIYSENNLSTHPKAFSLPVGFATHSKEYEDKLLMLKEKVNLEKKIDKVFCCWRQGRVNCCGEEFSDRNSKTEFLKTNSVVNFYQSLPQDEFHKKLSEHKWCLCTVGNGTDPTPCILECFFLKTIPILRKNINTFNLYNKYPVIWLNEYSDFDNIDLKYDYNINWENILEEFKCEYWKNKILNHLND